MNRQPSERNGGGARSDATRKSTVKKPKDRLVRTRKRPHRAGKKAKPIRLKRPVIYELELLPKR